jgi:hypothetical protein
MSQHTTGIQPAVDRAAAASRAPHQNARPQPDVGEPSQAPKPATSVSISKDAQHVSAIKEYVRRLFEQQGIELKGAIWDEMSVEDAQVAIAEGGEWSAGAVADRIIGFVAEISGGDAATKERLQKAVQQGFEEARQAFGGWLPEVSERTYDLVMERFDEAFEPSAQTAEGSAA